MDVNNFLRDIKTHGFESYFSASKSSYYLFERLTLRLLSKHLEAQGKPFFPNYKLRSRAVDGYAPEGFDEFLGPTLIEIKLLRGTLLKNIPSTFDNVLAILALTGIQNVLLVIGTHATQKERARIKQLTKGWPKEYKVTVWYADAVLDLLQRYAEFVSDLIPEVTELAVNNVVKKSLDITSDDWKKIRDRHTAQLRASYLANDLALFLGAGISQSAGIPNWQSLISSLLVALIGEKLPGTLGTTDNEKKVIAGLIQGLHGSSPLLETRYIRRGLSESFVEMVSKYLYEGIGAEDSGTSETLEAIAQLCIPPRSGPGVRALITYNFDDLVERHLRNLGIKHRPVYKDGDVASQDELGIYHVHGFLPQDVSQYDGLAESLLVFSEEGYHAVLLEPYSWSNLVQLNFLREGTCLLVGLSVTDPNLRRLLDIAARKNKTTKHFVFLKRLAPSDLDSNSSKRVRAEVTRAFLTVHHQLQEASFSELGLNIIWLESYDEIPQILGSLRK